jgi:archaellin
MRLILAVAATAFAASAIVSTAAYAQQTAQTTGQAPSNPAAARASLNDNYNKCVSLARSRGYTDSDLDGNRAAARNFVIRCMQGKQR